MPENKIAWKVEIKQYPDGPHVCIADENGTWIADIGHSNNSITNDDAEFIVRACNNYYSLLEACSCLLADWDENGTDNPQIKTICMIEQAVAGTEKK